MKFTHSPGATPVDGFTIRRGIHRGGFGEVYYAVSDAGKEVALKLLQHDQDVELRGVKQCLNLKHPNLVNLFDVRADSHGEQWVVMEYVNGSSLEDVLAAFPNGLPLDEVRDWLTGMVAGVAHLHDRGIVHRDLKPANVYRENGVVKVGDVGLSKRLGSDRRGAHTQSVGTVYYMAPEVARGQYGPEVDVYSLGILLYELLTGRVPFNGETTAEILMKHLTVKPDLTPIPERLRPVLARALEKDPQQRTPTVKQLEEEFLRATNPVSDVWSSAPQSHQPRNGSDTKFAAPWGSRPGDPPPASPGPPPLQKTIKVESRRKPMCVSAPPTAMPYRQRWIALIIVFTLGLIMFSPGSWRSWSGLVLIGGAYSIALLTRYRTDASGFVEQSAVVEKPRTEPTPGKSQPTRPISSSAMYVRIPRQTIGESAVSLTLASLCACLLSAGAWLSVEFFQRTPLLPSSELMSLFTATSLAGAWATLIAGWWTKRPGWSERHPRKTYLLAGLLIGSLAFFLDEFLLVEYTQNYFARQPAFRSLGVHPLTTGGMNPTWLGYVVFFGGMMFLHRWWLDMDPQRKHRISVGRLLTAGLAAWLMTVFFAFPEWPAILWAATISASVQLASPWSPSRRRDSFWRV